jgi:hypothetical protein
MVVLIVFTRYHVSLTASPSVDRVRWFRARANRDRWREEVEILEEEFRSTYRSFTRMSEVWEQLATRCETSLEGRGRRAYAYRQVLMYDEMARTCQGHYEDAHTSRSMCGMK